MSSSKEAFIRERAGAGGAGARWTVQLGCGGVRKCCAGRDVVWLTAPACPQTSWWRGLPARHGALSKATAAGGGRRRHPPATARGARQLTDRQQEAVGPRSQPGIVRCWCFRPLPICRPHRRKRWVAVRPGGRQSQSHRSRQQTVTAGSAAREDGASAWERSFQGTQDPS